MTQDSQNEKRRKHIAVMDDNEVPTEMIADFRKKLNACFGIGQGRMVAIDDPFGKGTQAMTAPEYTISHLPPDEIDRLRLQAFKTNDDKDILAYYKAASSYFQDRHVRAMNRAHDTQSAIAAAMMGAVKPLEWKDLGLGWAAYDPLFETQVVTEDREKYDAERATRILSALSIPAYATAARDAMLADAEQRGRDQALNAVILTIMEHNMRYGINDGHNDLTDEISAMKGRDA